MGIIRLHRTIVSGKKRYEAWLLIVKYTTYSAIDINQGNNKPGAQDLSG